MHLPNPNFAGRMWHNVYLKWNKAGFNSKCSFSLIGCLTKFKETSLPNFYMIRYAFKMKAISKQVFGFL